MRHALSDFLSDFLQVLSANTLYAQYFRSSAADSWVSSLAFILMDLMGINLINPSGYTHDKNH
jgi:hypothetical protein